MSYGVFTTIIVAFTSSKFPIKAPSICLLVKTAKNTKTTIRHNVLAKEVIE